MEHVESRRDAVRRKEGWNGLDYVEVAEDALSLDLYFLGKLPKEFIDNHNADLSRLLKVTGGRQITDIEIIKVEPHPDTRIDRDDFLVVRFNKSGDFSTYTMKLVDVKNIDPRYQSLDFSFKNNCPSDLDCVTTCTSEPKQYVEPEINYLAKDYASFKQLILDRLAQLMPDWNERHAPDLMITLIEILAYVGDYLSYYQDAAATEAYLSTARKRISVRRHARLVDYKLHEGCNSRAWMSVEFGSEYSNTLPDLFDEQSPATLVTNLRSDLQINTTQINWEDIKGPSVGPFEVFEPLPLPLQSPSSSFNSFRTKIEFYTWGEKQYHLPKGCTSATLKDKYVGMDINAPRALDSLKAGDVLIFEEVIRSETGEKNTDSNSLRRHAVKLTSVCTQEDGLFQIDKRPIPILNIEWAEEDALPFSLMISGITAAPLCEPIENISIARGNVFLADFGKTVELEYLGMVSTAWSLPQCEGSGIPSEIESIPVRFRPHLSLSPLTFAEPVPKDVSGLNSASSFLIQNERNALPRVELFSLPARLCRHFDFSLLHNFIPKIIHEKVNDSFFLEFKGKLPPCLSECFQDDRLPVTRWEPRFDLLSSQTDDFHFVVEIDDQGIAQLRFGDGTLGAQPEAGSVFYASYRVGNGARGNVGADSISYLISGGNLKVRNLLPAVGGTEPEPISEAKLYAPGSFRKIMERAITADDYRLLAQRNKKLQRAAAELVWAGSWYEADVFIDQLGNEVPLSTLLDAVKNDLRQYRRMGHDIRVRAAKYVPIELILAVHVKPHYQQAHVKAALLDSFSNRSLAGGNRGFFHPDNFSFGDSVEVSHIITAGMAVSGVEDIAVMKLKRMFEMDSGALEKGFLAMSSQEIAQLNNDPNFPEHGKLVIKLFGRR